MFNIGAGEIIVMLLVAFIVVGPGDLPKIARGIAKGIKYIKNSIQDIVKTLNIEEELQSVKEANDTIRTTLQEANPITLLQKEVNDVKKTVTDTVDEVNPLPALKKEVGDAAGIVKDTVKETKDSVKVTKDML